MAPSGKSNDRSSRASIHHPRNHSVNLTDKLLNIYGPQLAISRKNSGRLERERAISQIAVSKKDGKLPEIKSNRDLSRMRANIASRASLL